MSIYTGCKCPVCQQPFQENDDIVVCPECGAPYHRSCYQKQGGCVFNDKHAPGFEWKPDPAANEAASNGQGDPSRFTDPQVNCPVCGAPNPGTGLFCENCGAPLNRTALSGAPNPSQQSANSGANGFAYGPAAANPNDPFSTFQNNFVPDGLRLSPNDELEGIKASDWAAFLGKNSAYYLMNFKAMQATGRKITACFSAFFFGPFYFFYRKMWSAAGVLLLLNTILRIPVFLQIMMMEEHPLVSGLAPEFLAPFAMICSVLNILFMFAQGMFALSFYKKDGARRIRKILDQTPAEGDKAAALQKAGGTSTAALVISLILVTVAIYAACTFAMWPMFQL